MPAAGSGLLTSPLVTEAIYVGNAGEDAPANRGWLLGHFKPPDDARHSDEVEIKWAVHAEGDRRADWVVAEQRSALILLVSGRFRVDLPGRSALLAEQGDYVVFRGVSHSWEAEEASVVVAVRWPSIPGYAISDEARSAPGTMGHRGRTAPA
jgi:hypothetical protein